MDIASEIQKYIEGRGITQTSIARKTGIKPARLNLMIRGKRSLPLLDYVAICDALQVPEDTFFKMAREVRDGA